MGNSLASDPGLSEEGAKSMTYKAPHVAAIFFMTSFNRDRGEAMAPLPPPPGSAAAHPHVRGEHGS